MVQKLSEMSEDEQERALKILDYFTVLQKISEKSNIVYVFGACPVVHRDFSLKKIQAEAPPVS